VRVNGFEGAEITVEELADHFAEPGIILGKTCRIDRMPASDQRLFEQVDLSAFSATVDSFNGDEYAGRSHVRKPV